MRIIQACAIAMMALQASALSRQPMKMIVMKRSQTNETTVAEQTVAQTVAQNVVQNVVENDYKCTGSCVFYVPTQQEADALNSKVDKNCDGSCAFFVSAPTARRFLPGSHERRQQEVANF